MRKTDQSGLVTAAVGRLNGPADILPIIALSFPFLFWGVSMDFIDPNEGMFGSIAREMAESGDWVTPRFNGVPYFEMPPLYYWLSALMIYLFGPTEWAARFWGSISALGTVLLVWRMGNLLYGRNAGLLAGVILVTSVGFFRYSHVAFTDMLFVFSLTLSIYGFIQGFLHDTNPKTRYLLFYVGAALAVLSKGLVGLAFPVLIVGSFILWRRPHVDLKSLNLIKGLCLFFALVLPWHLLAAWKNAGFLWFYFVDNQFLRFFQWRNFLENDVQIGILAFLFVFQVWTFPWSLLIPVSLRPGFPRLREDSSPAEIVRLVVGLWALVVLGFFCLSSARLEHYSLPVLPAVSLLVGAKWAEVWKSPAPDRGLKFCLGSGAVSCILMGVGLIWLANNLAPEDVAYFLSGLAGDYRALDARGGQLPYPLLPFVQLTSLLGWVLLLGPLVAFLCLAFGKVRSSFGFFVVTAAAIAILVFRLFLIFEPYHSTKALASTLAVTGGTDEMVVHEGQLIDSGGLPFYSGRKIYILEDGVRGDLAFGSRYPETHYLFLDQESFLNLWNSRRRMFLVYNSWSYPAQKNVSRHLRGRAYLVGQYGLRKLYTNRPPTAAEIPLASR